MADSTNLQLPYLEASQAQKHVTHNEALRLLDALVQSRVTEQGLTTPPGAPADGTLYIPGSGATGAWASWDFNLAYYVDGAWKKIVPRVGWLIYDINQAGFYVFEGAPNYWAARSMGGAPPRRSVRVATTGNVTIAAALNDGDAIDGVTLADDDLVLVKDQTADEENGVYVVGVTPSRHSDFATFEAHVGVFLSVQEGSANADTLWLGTSNAGGTLDTSALAFTQFTGGSGGGGGGSGDMLAATYDPTSVAGDAFSMANMVEATDAKVMTAAERTKLSGVEAGADVTDTANVAAAGALMDSEVDADIKTLSLPANTTMSAAGAALIDDADAAAQRTTLGLGSAALLAEATAAEFRDNTADRGLSTDQVWSAAEEVALADAATIAIDLSTFINGKVDPIAGNRTFGNPTNAKVGQTGFIRIVQDATGGRTLSFGTNWKFENGTAPSLSTAANAEDILVYWVIAANRTVGVLLKGIPT